MTQFDKRNISMMMDFYEMTMANGYFVSGGENTRVAFDVFYRRNPDNGGFAIFAGLEQIIEYVENMHFDESDIEYFRAQNIFSEEFLNYLSNFHFHGDIYAFPEGTIMYPNEPFMTVVADLIDAQLVETAILSQVNHQSLIATKARRIVRSAEGRFVSDFGARRAHNMDAATYGARAAFIGGAAGTSNTLAGKIYGIPVMGTMAHSWIMAFPSELEAFRAYAQIYPTNAVFLIDTYDTLRSGIKNAIIAGRELVEKGYNFGVRLDSGDISYLTREVRKELDKAGFPQAKICVSNELTEEIIETLVLKNTPIDSWGVGTHMVTGGNEASFTGVYKLGARHDEKTNEMKAAMKFSDNPEKNTNPGIKNVYRLYDAEGNAKADIIALEDEKIEAGTEYRYYHTMIDYRQFTFKASKVEPMLKKVVADGKRVDEKITEAEVLRKARETMQKQLESFDGSYKRILNPHIYKVSLTEAMKNLKMEFIKARIK